VVQQEAEFRPAMADVAKDLRRVMDEARAVSDGGELPLAWNCSL
jgi:hypothetical protein